MKALTKSALVDRVFDRHLALTNREAKEAVDEVLRAAVCALKNGIRVEIRGFGSFSLRRHEARLGRNPRTGEPIQIPAKYVPGFRAGKEFRTLLNGKAHNEELGVS